jgi:hypothetical protein
MSRRSEVSEFKSEFKIRPEDVNQNKHVQIKCQLDATDELLLQI